MELEACPFCGNEKAKLESFYCPNRVGYYVRCTWCGSRGPGVIMEKKTEAEAQASQRWNRRCSRREDNGAA